MSSCRTIRTDSRIRSTPSPARKASSSSDTADWDNAIGGVLFSVFLAVHTEDPADGHLASAGHAVTHQTPPPHGTQTSRPVRSATNDWGGGEIAPDVRERW